MSARLSFSWAMSRTGNDGWVLESVPGSGYRKLFGPMPPHVVPAFTTARRTLIALKMKSIGASYIDDEVLDKLTPILSGPATAL